MIVTKFGGSSMADAAHFQQVKRILQQNPHRRVVVVSAAGKGIDHPVKLTDQLIAIYHLIQSGQDYSNAWRQVVTRIVAIADALHLKLPLQAELERMNHAIKDWSYAELVSRGEYLTARLFAAYLDWPMVDAADFLVLSNGQVDYAQSQTRLLALTQGLEYCVIPGFYGVDAAKHITLLPRGGGDTSGAVVANLLDAQTYENWTDTNGILAVDPRIVDQPTQIAGLSYEELQELSYLGVQVFNEEAIQPVRMKQIPIRIMNTNHPERPGTCVAPNKSALNVNSAIAGIAGTPHLAVLMVKKYQLSNNVAELLKLIQLVTARHLKTTYSVSGDGITFSLAGSIGSAMLTELVNKIKQMVHPDQIQIKTNVAKLAVVSESFRTHPQLVGQLLDTLAQHQINVYQVIQTNSDIKVVFGVDRKDYQTAIECLYDQFFRKLDWHRKLVVNS